MERIKVFISSVQNEFANERAMLFDYLRTDALLGQFFEPFIFEKHSATNQSAQDIYLDKVKECNIYLGIFGEKYGFEDAEGVSPTEREYDLATGLHKTRLIYIKRSSKKEEKEMLLIRKAEKELVRKSFSDKDELKTEIYASLIRYLEENEYLRLLPFDATFNRYATLDDIDEKKVAEFVRRARKKRNFPFDETADFSTILARLNLLMDKKVTNAAILLFGKNPQKFMITSSVKCCQFYGNKVEKPIPSYHIYDGDVFQLIDQATSFVLTRIDAKVGDRKTKTHVDVELELPQDAVREAIVNAICHRDYTSNMSVQVMLFRNRLEIWNPGHLPFGLTTDMLKTTHSSLPANPLLARPMYLYGSIEQVGTGTEMIVEQCNDFGLRPPTFEETEIFKITFWRKNTEQQDGKIIVNHVPENVPENVPEKRLNAIIQLMNKDETISMLDIAILLNVNHKTIKRDIEKLKARGIVERIGADKGGYWQINTKQNGK
jgi:predicted HTH transcriptional regulator